MDALQELFADLEQFSRDNDSKHKERSQRMLNITHDTGEFLSVLVRAMLARRILEIGTSNGYSTLWLASAAQAIDGLVTTVESSDFKVELAAKNFYRSGLGPFIHQIHEDAGPFLGGSVNGTYDFIFLDSDRDEYPGWWPDLKRIIRPGGLLVVDNALSHAEELAMFIALIEADADFTTSLVPVGNGEFMAVRA